MLEDEDFDINLEGFDSYYVNAGRGKGIATYTKATLKGTYKETRLQIVKSTLAEVDIIMAGYLKWLL